MKIVSRDLSPKYVQLYRLQALEKKLIDWMPYKTSIRDILLIYSNFYGMTSFF